MSIPADSDKKASGSTVKPTSGDDNAIGLQDAPLYPNSFALTMILLGLLLSMFLVALDMTIVATAIPRITDEFHSIQDVGWYGSSFFVTLAVFQSPWGKAYKYFPLKISFFAAVIFFEIGSLICGVAPSSVALIVGRAIAGVGAAGITGGCYVIIAYSSPPEKTPTYIGLLGAVFSLASVAGPLVGGAFTEKVSWRWCFYVNLPIGGCALALLFFCFKEPVKAKADYTTWKEIALQMDPAGTCSILAALVCFILALQWGGTSKSWSSPDVIGCLVGWALLTCLFAVLQWKEKERALIVPRILRSKVVLACSVFIFFMNAANFLMIYYLPIYFQAIGGASPAMSGVRNLPLILASSIATMISSSGLQYIRYFQIPLVFGTIFLTVGAGLLYTLDIGSSAGLYIGYQVLFGIGVGTVVQVPVITAQAFSTLEDIPTTTAVVLFFQFVSGALSVSAAENIFNNRMLAALLTLAPGTKVVDVLATGATELRTVFAGNVLQGVLESYMKGLDAVWALGTGLAGVSFLLSLVMPRFSLPGTVE